MPQSGCRVSGELDTASNFVQVSPMSFYARSCFVSVSIASAVALSIAVVPACSGSTPNGGFGAAPSLADAGSDRESPTPPPPAPIDLSDAASIGNLAVELSGVTYAPNGTLPIGNTLVYVSSSEPAPQPTAAFCDKCVELEEGRFTYSKPNGAFTLTTSLPQGTSYLVVQKGQFRRTRKLTVTAAGKVSVGKADSTLPGKTDAAKGDFAPTMAILKDATDFDKIDESLSKLGITQFDIFTDRTMLDNLARMQAYQIVFIPCGSNDDERSRQPLSRGNLGKYVRGGGRLYVTDWSYEFVRQPFGGFLKFAPSNGSDLANPPPPSFGDDTVGEYDGAATVNDTGLRDWLAATGDTAFPLKGNYTQINAVNTLPGRDENGADVLITPKVWMSVETANAGVKPSTVSFGDTCGRVLFSTYHTEGSVGGGSGTLLPQEKALLYTLLEVTVCVGKPPQVN
jgi:hypothetical protein